MSVILLKKNKNIKVYDVLTKNAMSKILASYQELTLDKFIYEGKIKYKTIIYDTKDNLLSRTGILLYKTLENGEYFFKIERLEFLPSVSKLRKDDTFIHKINEKDTPKSEAFYLIRGITEMFSTQFIIDLEYVVKNVVPKFIMEFETTTYKAFKANGFKASLDFETIKYSNEDTKRKKVNTELTVRLASSEHFNEDYKGFIVLLEKYCKDICPKLEDRFEFAKITTKPVSKDTKIDKKTLKENKRKQKKSEDIIQG